MKLTAIAEVPKVSRGSFFRVSWVTMTFEAEERGHYADADLVRWF